LASLAVSDRVCCMLQPKSVENVREISRSTISRSCLALFQHDSAQELGEHLQISRSGTGGSCRAPVGA
jgi:hypothetical protein